MSGFYYFFPRAGGLALIQRAGLADRFATAPTITQVDAELGPGGLPGTVFHAGGTHLVPRAISWKQAVTGDYWVGLHPLRRPRPTDLERDEVVMGSWVTLGDGNDWLVPLVLPCTDADPQRRSGLPSRPRLAVRRDAETLAELRAAATELLEQDTGEHIDAAGHALLRCLYAAEWTPAACYDALRFEAARIVEAEPGERDCWPFVCGCLSVAYRLGPDEIEALGLIDSDSGRRVALAAVDFEERVRVAAALDAAGAC